MKVRLESKRVTATIERLALRIKDRFPTSDLYAVCTHLHNVARLYVESFHDTEVTNAATELEDLCSGLSRKIWQKIMILRIRGEAGAHLEL